MTFRRFEHPGPGPDGGSRTQQPDVSTTLRGGARGLAAAMAMTGFRTLTANLGLLETAPPEAIVRRHAPRVLRRSRSRRVAAAELAHWMYGAGCGILFGFLPRRVRAHVWTGPSYGLAIWLTFELAIAPGLNLQHNKQRRVLGRVTLALDHALYGVIVAGRLAPEPELIAQERRRSAG